MIRPPPRYTQSRSSAASDVYKRQLFVLVSLWDMPEQLSGHSSAAWSANLYLNTVSRQPSPKIEPIPFRVSSSGCNTRHALYEPLPSWAGAQYGLFGPHQGIGGRRRSKSSGPECRW